MGEHLGGHAGPGVGDPQPGVAAWLAGRAGPRVGLVTVTFAVSMVSFPPPGIASRALTARLTRTCSSCPASALTGHRSPAGATIRVMCSPRVRPSSCSRPAMTVRLSTSGCTTSLRAKISSWWVSLIARCAARGPARRRRARCPAARPRRQARYLLRDQVRKPADQVQQVIEVMRDPADQLAQALHPLGVPQPVLRRGPLSIRGITSPISRAL